MKPQDIVVRGDTEVVKEPGTEFRVTIADDTPGLVFTGRLVAEVRQKDSDLAFWKYAFLALLLAALCVVCWMWFRAAARPPAQ